MRNRTELVVLIYPRRFSPGYLPIPTRKHTVSPRMGELLMRRGGQTRIQDHRAYPDTTQH